MEGFVQGSHYWLYVLKKCHAAVVTEVKGGNITFTTSSGEVHSIPQGSITSEMAIPMHQSSVDGVEDMARLGDLHESAILHNLQLRYTKDEIYTHIGSILVALNPYKSVEGLYSEEKTQSYNGRYLGDLPPHINAISNEAYYAMWRKGGHQCILISGESGAGKTESTKHILKYLSSMSKHAVQTNNNIVTDPDRVEVEEAIIQSSPILEAFGNAKTVYNNNSSRFGKFMELDFSEDGNITGGVIVDYLLEKNRVVSQNPAERNFHIFYSLCAGISAEEKSKYLLYDPEKYHYLNQSGCISDPSINDARDYKEIISAMNVLGLSGEQMENIHFVLSSILQLGNINFISTGGAQVNDSNVLENLSNLLQVDIYQLKDALTVKKMMLRGEEIFTPLTVEQAVDSRDSIAMALYRACFNWLIHKINGRLKGNKDFFSIGVLDIFGFENFKVNRFEQFNINFANEKLQEYFNKHIFSLEQLEYNREGIQWSDIDWNDNGECLDLVEKKIGLLSLIDEESHFPKGTDASLLTKLHDNHANNPFYIKPRVADTRFGIQHYAGEVYYDTVGFLSKNRDTFREDLLATLKESRSEFIYDLFDTLEKMMEKPPTTGGGGGRGKKPKKPTVSSQFKDSLFSLMTKLNNANPYFVRCVKPNSDKVPNTFENDLVLNQLKYSGMLETVKIRKAGFPVRRMYHDFLERYKILFYRSGHTMLVDDKDNCLVLLNRYDAQQQLHCIGKTKIFMKDKLEADLEVERNKTRRLAGEVIGKVIMGYSKRKRYLHIRKAIVNIQKIYRGHYYHMKYIRIQRAVIMIQKFERGRKARKLYAEMLEEKRLEEERKREEERRREEEHQRELERLEQERKLQELEELKKKKEEEERIRLQEEEEKRQREEQQRQLEIAKLRELEELKRIEEQRRKAEEETKRQEYEMRMREEEEIRLREEEEERIRIEEEKAMERMERERIDKEATEAALRQMAELDEQLQREEDELDDEDFDDDTISRISVTDEEESGIPTMDGYLYLKGGLMSTPKKHWCVLKEDTLMWFRQKQQSLKSGWMTKKGGGTGTFARRNWKRRWFVLQNTVLTYYENDQEGAKALGTIDLRECKEIQESGQKDNSISLVTEDRTYFIVTDTYQDWNDWYGILNRVFRANEDELLQMKDETANIKNAVGTIDTILMESITIELFDDKTNGFTVVTANRVYSFSADTTVEITNWVDALHKSKETQLEEGQTVSVEKGWLIKRGSGTTENAVTKGDKKRWFTLSHNSLDYFKSSEKNSPKLGSIVLQSLCTVHPPPPPDDVKSKEAGQWEFSVDGRKRSYHLVTSTYEESLKWYTAIKEVIDQKPPAQTVYQKLMEDIMSANSEAYVDRVYRVNPLLLNTKQPLRMPLLPLPYGFCSAPRAQGKNYGNYYDEAVRIFNSLLELEKVADYLQVIQGILQTCHDMKELRDEIYCQLIKQTTGLEDPNHESGIRYMQVLVCMCCTFLPQRKVLRFLRFHLKRIRDQVPESETAKFADFALDSLKKTRVREFPPSRQEIITLLGRRKIQTTVHCYGEGSCQITIDSSTTSGEVVDTLCKGMKIKQDNLIFGLFERCGPAKEFSIEDRQIVADVLSKFEQYEKTEKKKGRHKWQLFFRIFCFIDPGKVNEESVEGQFLYEQTCEHIQRGRYLLPEMTLCKLAALRLQYLEGDHVVGSWIDKEINSIYPVLKLKKKARIENNKTAPKKDFGTFKGTISNIKKAMAQYKAEEELSELPKYDIDEELSAIKSSIMSNWKMLQGTPPENAQVQYMSIVRNWHGFGSTMFYVTSKDPTMPPELSLGVSFNNVAIYKRDETRPLATYNYEDITQFGAKANTYRIAVLNRNPIFLETDKTIEISKLMKAYINEIVKISRRKSMQLRNSMDFDQYDEMT